MMNCVDRVDALEREVRTLRTWLGAGMIGFVGMVAMMAMSAHADASDPGILRARGLIIEDAEGRPRIAMGAPLAGIAGRTRTDALTGVVYLDANGADRVTIGQQPDPMTVDGVRPRRTGGTGILIHDRDGVERGGYGVLDDNMALLTLDYPRGSEGVAISAGENFSAVGVFHSGSGYREAVTIGATVEPAESFVKVGDTAGVERMRVSLRGQDSARVSEFDGRGQPVPERTGRR